ncbi:MAG: hypothetical protein OXN96_12975 [Bryobacterales bacterium]|nr:hypothetical protein [Bryobacterales bacterium]
MRHSWTRVGSFTNRTPSNRRFPPRTSRRSQIEHRMCLHVTQNRCGRRLASREVVVNLVGKAPTKEGLTIQSERDENRCETGHEVSDEEFKTPSIDRASFHGG